MPSVTCKDIGMNGTFEAQGTTGRELIRKFIDNAETGHKMQVLPADILFKIQKATRK